MNYNEITCHSLYSTMIYLDDVGDITSLQNDTPSCFLSATRPANDSSETHQVVSSPLHVLLMIVLNSMADHVVHLPSIICHSKFCFYHKFDFN